MCGVPATSLRCEEALALLDRALVECKYTRETGPIRGGRDFLRDDKRRENEDVLPPRGGEGGKEKSGEKVQPKDNDLPLSCFSADLLHALRGEALLEMWRQSSEVYVHLLAYLPFYLHLRCLYWSLARAG